MIVTGDYISAGGLGLGFSVNAWHSNKFAGEDEAKTLKFNLKFSMSNWKLPNAVTIRREA